MLIWPSWPSFEVNGLDWQYYLAGSSQTAPRIFIFSIVLGAEYLSYAKSIATFALTFFGDIISVLASVLTGLWKIGPITLDVGAASNVWLVPPNFELSFKIMLWIVDLSGEKVPSLCLLLIFFCSTNWVGTFSSVQVILCKVVIVSSNYIPQNMTTNCQGHYLLWTSFCSGSRIQMLVR